MITLPPQVTKAPSRVTDVPIHIQPTFSGIGTVVKTSYRSTKTYGNSAGLSAAFRQWRATDSHCSKIHGYALGFKFIFGAMHLDDRNWVADFGSLKPLKLALEDHFDHVFAVAHDDPQIAEILRLGDLGLAKVRVFDYGVGCERFACKAFSLAAKVVKDKYPDGRVWVESAECFEHDANSAIYTEERVAF